MAEDDEPSVIMTEANKRIVLNYLQMLWYDSALANGNKDAKAIYAVMELVKVARIK
tara:strand:+ start:1951 stop:2118 length:168 start_codon:yes stop_codon:yes gene_type:complete